MNEKKKLTIDDIKNIYGEILELRNKLEASLSVVDEYSAKYDETMTEISQSVDIAKQSAADAVIAKDEAVEGLGIINSNIIEASRLHEEISEFSKFIGEVEERIKKTEDKMVFIISEAAELKKRVDGLLPGATSAGLASAFKERRESFKTPAIGWSSVFILSMTLLVIIAFYNPVDFKLDDITQSNFHMYIIMRLPFVIPIMWLAIHAAHRHNQALRLEEEYAHKEAISKSFEGYKNQLLEIQSDPHGSAAEHLIYRSLEALSRHPGLIYDAKREDVSPFGVIKELFSDNSKNTSHNDRQTKT